MQLFIKEDSGQYRLASECEIKDSALIFLQEKIKKDGVIFDSPDTVKNFICLQIGDLPHEVFGVIFVDSQHRMIEYREMFRGTLNQTSVYPREVAKEALLLNAGAVILAHNHPSGSLHPSNADITLTSKLKSALNMIDVRVLDHFIVSGSSSISMAEKGLI